MLTRIKYRRDFRQFIRFLADKPSDSDDKFAKNKVFSKKDSNEDPTADLPEGSREKIQALLKSMLTAKPVISEKEYMEKFSVAPEKKPRVECDVEPDEFEMNSEQIEENITKAAGDVAQALGGDVKQTESELLSKVLGSINNSPANLSDLLIGMKVDRTTEKDNFKRETRGQQVKRLVDKSKDQNTTRFTQRKTQQSRIDRPQKSIPTTTLVNVFSGEPLGIFKSQEKNYGTKLDVWETLNERELNLATSQPSANYFHKMIQWTEQGKVWKFPIDNEQGLEEEQNIHFSDHIFLDSQLEDWCPKRGPIRHFMELVCVGLSKNAFYTIQEKKDHIAWYKEYFESKKDLLSEVGAWDVPKPSAEAST